MNDTGDIEKSWSVLSFAISEIVNKNASKLSFEQLYRKCYHLVLRKHGDELYKNVKKQLIGHLLEKRAVLIDSINSSNKPGTASTNTNSTNSSNSNEISFNANVLSEINKEWEDFCLCMRMISDVLMYLDRVYVKELSLPLTYDVGITLFKDYVIQYNQNEIGNVLNNILMNGIANNRNGRLVDKFLIKSVIKMYELLWEDNAGEYEANFYLKSFEPFFMERSYLYYSNLSNDLMKLENGEKYINRVNEIIIEEENMSVIYLPKVTFPRLIQLLDSILISNNISKVMDFKDQGFTFWVLNDKYEQLGLLYNLVSRVDKNHSIILSYLKHLVYQEGLLLESKVRQSINNEQSQLISETSAAAKLGKRKNSKENHTQFAIQWIDSILKFKEKFDTILTNAFQKDVNIQTCIESAFSEFLNKNPKVSEYLSLFIDSNIKKSSKNKTEEECEVILDKAVVVFRYVKDKDMFEKYYKNHLTRRLLQQKSMSVDIERLMISKLRQELGSLYTAKFEGMFRDMKVSNGLTVGFNNMHSLAAEPNNNNNNNSNTIPKKINFETYILTTTFWPIQPTKDTEIRYPDTLNNIKTKFEEYYLSKHRGRNLTWAPTFGSVDIRTRYKKKLYEINMPTYAAIIMLLFETRDLLTFEEIQELTQIPKNELIRHLLSISVAPRTRLLKKLPMSKDINSDDKFQINENFESSSSRIKVLTVSLATKVENDDERKETMENIKSARRFEIDAAIVRIMKSRKTLAHNELMAEIIKQLSNRFSPPPQFIKLRIESLLEREYLARSSEDKGVYNYLA